MQETVSLNNQPLSSVPLSLSGTLIKMARSVLTHLQSLIFPDYANVVQFDVEARVGTILATEVGSPCYLEKHWKDENIQVPVEALISQSIGQGQIDFVTDLNKVEASHLCEFFQALQGAGMQSVLSVPILADPSKAQVLGVIILAAKPSNFFTPAQINFVTQMAQMLALTMESNQMPSFTENHNGKIKHPLAQSSLSEVNNEPPLSLQWNEPCRDPSQALIKTLTQQIRQELDLKSVLNLSVTKIREILEADRVLIYRTASSRPTSVIAESVTHNTQSMLGFIVREPCVTQNNFLQCYKQGYVQAIEDIRAANLDPDHIEFLNFFDVKSLLVIPLLQDNFALLSLKSETDRLPNPPNNQLWGLLVIHQCRYHRQWFTHEIEGLRTLAMQLEIAIQQARLVDGVQQLKADFTTQIEAVNEQLQQAQALEWMLKRVIDKIHGNVDERQILQTTVQELIQILSLSAAQSSVYNTEQTSATLSYSSQTEFTQEHPLPVAEFPELYRQLFQRESYQFSSLNLQTLEGEMTVLVCPIVDCEITIGDLWLYKWPDESFCEWEIQLVQFAASQCAIALRQARLYQFAQAQVAQLARLNQLKDDFLSTVSHELRTPLANMKMALQMLAISLNQETEFFAEFSKPPEARSKVARYFQIVRNECEREIQLINDLLEFQQLDAESDNWMPMLIELDQLISHVVEPFTEVIQKHRQTLEVEIPSGLPAIESDPQMLERILKELLTNASKYTPAHETIRVKAGYQQDRVFIQVTNTGVEIPTDELQQIFKKFYRIPKADPWQQGGTGLGLAVLQKLTHRLGGTVQVNSEDHQTTFTVDFPIKRSTLFHLNIDDKSGPEMV